MSFLQNLNTSNLIWRDTGGEVIIKNAHEAMFRQLVTYCSDGGDITAINANGGNTGTGTIDNLHSGPGAPPETWTITMISGTTFSVVGSSSGSQAVGNVDVGYRTNGTTENALLQLTLSSGANNGDIWTITVSAFGTPVTSSATWVLDRWRPNGNLYNSADALIWHGQGAGGTEAIHCGIKLTTDIPSSSYNWILRNYTGFTSSGDWDAQPGQSGIVYYTLNNNNFAYWLAVSGRRYALYAQPGGSVDVLLYQGFIDAYGSPAEYPFPSFMCGTSPNNVPSTDISNSFHTWTFASQQGELRDPAGAWLNFNDDAAIGNVRSWPNSNSTTNSISVWSTVEDLGGDSQLFPAIMFQGPTTTGSPLTSQVYGELEGVAVVSGFGLTPASVLTIGADTWVAFPDCFRTADEGWLAIKME